MKFNEKLLSIRKKEGLSQEELGFELGVSRQTISKWESGQSYPDFEKLVLLSDFFGQTLDQLVKDVDVEDVRNKNLTDDRISSIFSDVEKAKSAAYSIWRILCYIGIGVLGAVIIGFIAKTLFSHLDFLWVIK